MMMTARGDWGVLLLTVRPREAVGRMTAAAGSRPPRRWILLLLQLRCSTRCRLLTGGKI
eukprot:COSAG04_NODE_11528_length_704_cov_1.014876_1_plen_58_part_10